MPPPAGIELAHLVANALSGGGDHTRTVTRWWNHDRTHHIDILTVNTPEATWAATLTLGHTNHYTPHRTELVAQLDHDTDERTFADTAHDVANGTRGAMVGLTLYDTYRDHPRDRILSDPTNPDLRAITVGETTVSYVELTAPTS